MADLLLDLIHYLARPGVGVVDPLLCFRDFMPDTPDRVIVINEYAGRGSTTGVPGVVERSVQIVVRADRDSPDWARTKAWDIYKWLDTPEERILDLRGTLSPTGTPLNRWAILHPRQSPFRMDIDSVGRSKYGFNVGVVTFRD